MNRRGFLASPLALLAATPSSALPEIRYDYEITRAERAAPTFRYSVDGGDTWRPGPNDLRLPGGVTLTFGAGTVIK